jgi:hypothetical protein
LTIIRNRHRARDLRIFRTRVLAYFGLFEYDTENAPVDWDLVRAARADINRMLPRIAQIVQAADLGASTAGSMRSPAARAVEILHDVFGPRYAEGDYQEILDVIDMAVGVYDAGTWGSLLRTVNPFITWRPPSASWPACRDARWSPSGSCVPGRQAADWTVRRDPRPRYRV